MLEIRILGTGCPNGKVKLQGKLATPSTLEHWLLDASKINP